MKCNTIGYKISYVITFFYNENLGQNLSLCPKFYIKMLFVTLLVTLQYKKRCMIM